MNHPTTPFVIPKVKGLTPEQSKRLEALMKEDQEMVDLAIPAFKESHSSTPFYAARMNDERFWRKYAGSRMAIVKELAEKLKKPSTAAVIQPSQPD